MDDEHILGERGPDRRGPDRRGPEGPVPTEASAQEMIVLRAKLSLEADEVWERMQCSGVALEKERLRHQRLGLLRAIDMVPPDPV